jgi:hypothetical protein
MAFPRGEPFLVDRHAKFTFGYKAEDHCHWREFLTRAGHYVGWWERLPVDPAEIAAALRR